MYLRIWFFFLVIFFSCVSCWFMYVCQYSLVFFILSLITFKINFLHYSHLFFEHWRLVRLTDPRIRGSKKYKHMVIRNKPKPSRRSIFFRFIFGFFNYKYCDNKCLVKKKSNPYLRKPLLKSRKPWWMTQREYNYMIWKREFELKGGGYFFYIFGLSLQENFSNSANFILLFLFSIFCISSYLPIFHIYWFCRCVAGFFF